MAHYRCYIQFKGEVTKRHRNGTFSKHKYTRKSQVYYVNAQSPDQARSFVRHVYLDKEIHKGEKVDKIVASKQHDETVMEAIGAPSLFDLDKIN